MQTIKKAINLFGGNAKLSRELGVNKCLIYRWKKNISFPSTKTAQKIEEITFGEVRAIDILAEKEQIKLDLMKINEKIRSKGK